MGSPQDISYFHIHLHQFKNQVTKSQVKSWTTALDTIVNSHRNQVKNGQCNRHISILTFSCLQLTERLNPQTIHALREHMSDSGTRVWLTVIIHNLALWKTDGSEAAERATAGSWARANSCSLICCFCTCHSGGNRAQAAASCCLRNIILFSR